MLVGWGVVANNREHDACFIIVIIFFFSLLALGVASSSSGHNSAKGPGKIKGEGMGGEGKEHKYRDLALRPLVGLIYYNGQKHLHPL